MAKKTAEERRDAFRNSGNTKCPICNKWFHGDHCTHSFREAMDRLDLEVHAEFTTGKIQKTKDNKKIDKTVIELVIDTHPNLSEEQKQNAYFALQRILS